MKTPSKIINPNALKLLEQIEAQVIQEMLAAQEIPVSVLLWGPNPESDSEIATLRNDLRNELNSKGHLAKFSEEMIVDNGMSIRMQQLIHAQQFDLVVSLPYSPGSIGELHDFVVDKRVSSKLLVFLNSEYEYGYSNQSINAICSTLTFDVVSYDGSKDVLFIKETVFNAVQRVRDLKYFNQGRII